MDEKIKCPTEVAILLATYNGERFLREQIDSLLGQTYKDLTIYVHDDGSTDSTMSILGEYESKCPNLHVLNYRWTSGAMHNFFGLLANVDADYYFFCDQDDVWLSDKVEVSMARLKALEKEHGKDSPACVYSDLKVVDENLAETAPSFMKFEGICPQFLEDFDHAAVMNLATGCTMTFNRKARELTVYPYDKATMHDEWVVLCILKNSGHLDYIERPLILYRQHGGNTLGAQDMSRLTLAYRIRNAKTMARLLFSHYRMIKALGYGSFLKFIYYKIVYKIRTRQNR